MKSLFQALWGPLALMVGPGLAALLITFLLGLVAEAQAAPSYTQWVQIGDAGMLGCPNLGEKVAIHEENGFYEGFAGEDDGQGGEDMFHAFSKTGLRWSCHGDSIIGRPEVDHDPAVIKEAGVYHLISEVDSNQPSAALHYLTSQNAWNWTQEAWEIPGEASPVLVFNPAGPGFLLFSECCQPFAGADILMRQAATIPALEFAVPVPVYIAPAGHTAVPNSFIHDPVTGTYHLYSHIRLAPGNPNWPTHHMETADLINWSIPVQILPDQWRSFSVFRGPNGEILALAWNGAGTYAVFEGDDTPLPPGPTITVTINGLPTDFPVNGTPTFETGPSGIQTGALVCDGDDWVDLGLTGDNMPIWDISAWIRGLAPAIGPATGPWHLERASVFSWNHPNPNVGGVPLKLGAMAIKTNGAWKYTDWTDPADWGAYNHFKATYDGTNMCTELNGNQTGCTNVGAPIDVMAGVTMTLCKSSVADNFWPQGGTGAIDGLIINTGGP